MDYIMKHLLKILFLLTPISTLANTTLLVGFPPGGGQYIVTSIISDTMSRLDIPNSIIIKPGAGGIIGMNECASLNSKNTLCMSTNAQWAYIASTSSIRKYDPDLLNYLNPIIGVSPTVLITNINNKKTPKEIIEEIKSQKVSFGNGAHGVGQLTNFILRMLNSKMAVTAEYKGVGPVLIDLQGKHIDYAVVPYTAAKSLHLQNKIRVVFTFAELNEFTTLKIPKIQTFLPNLDENYTIYGFVMAQKIEQETIKSYEQLLKKVLGDTKAKEQLLEQGIYPLPDTFKNKIFRQIAKDERDKITEEENSLKK